MILKTRGATQEETILRALRICRTRPDLFNDWFLGRPPYWSAQVEWGRSVVENHTTCLVTGNALGKDYWIGGVIPWWLYTRPGSLVFVTGPSQTLLGSITWKEIRRAIEGAPIPMGAKLSYGVKASPQTVDLGSGWAALGFSTTNVERMSGQHAGQLLVVVEEASGADDEVWEAVDALKCTRLVAIGNPLRATGGFVRLIRQGEADFRDGLPPPNRVKVHTVPSTASPHADLDLSPVGLADRTWLNQVARKYGKDSLWYRSHVLAVVPEVSSEALIPEAWLDRAALPEHAELRKHRHGGNRRIAVDLGEGVGRDRTVVLVRDDLGVLDMFVSNTVDLSEAASLIARAAGKWHVGHGDITYDKLGIGKKLPNFLARHGIVSAVGYAGSGGSRSGEFTNLRSESGWRLHLRLDPNWCPDPNAPTTTQPAFHIPASTFWPAMREELKELTYDLVGKQTRLLPKEEWADRLGRSPDLADALIQSFSRP